MISVLLISALLLHAGACRQITIELMLLGSTACLRAGSAVQSLELRFLVAWKQSLCSASKIKMTCCLSCSCLQLHHNWSACLALMDHHHVL